jgi:hypothetical protein
MRKIFLLLLLFASLSGFTQRFWIKQKGIKVDTVVLTLVGDTVMSLHIKSDTLWLNGKFIRSGSSTLIFDTNGIGLATKPWVRYYFEPIVTAPNDSAKFWNGIKKFVVPDYNKLRNKPNLYDSIVADTTGHDPLCTGLIIYATSNNTTWQHTVVTDPITGDTTGCVWKDVAILTWLKSGNHVYLRESGNWVGIGTNMPLSQLDVRGAIRAFINSPSTGSTLLVGNYAGYGVHSTVMSGVAIYGESDSTGTAGLFNGKVRITKTPLLTKKPAFVLVSSADSTVSRYPFPINSTIDSTVVDTIGHDLLCHGLTIYATSDSTIWQHMVIIDTTTGHVGDTIGCKWVDISKAKWLNNGSDLYYLAGKVGIGKKPLMGTLDIDGNAYVTSAGTMPAITGFSGSGHGHGVVGLTVDVGKNGVLGISTHGNGVYGGSADGYAGYFAGRLYVTSTLWANSRIYVPRITTAASSDSVIGRSPTGEMVLVPSSGSSTYTAGYGLNLIGTQFNNIRYWGLQDSLKTTLSGLVLATAGKLTAITNGSANWNSGYTYRVTSATGTAPLTLTLAANALTGSVALFSTTSTTKGVVPGSNNVGANYLLNALGNWVLAPGNFDSLSWVYNATRHSVYPRYYSTARVTIGSNVTTANINRKLHVAGSMFLQDTLWFPSGNYLTDYGPGDGLYTGTGYMDHLYLFNPTRQDTSNYILGWNSGTGVVKATLKSKLMDSLYRYPAYSSGNNNVEVLATGTGITVTKSSGDITFTIPAHIRLISAKIRVESLSTVVCYLGTSDMANSSMANRWMPIVQAWREDTGQQLMGVTTLMSLTDNTKFTINGLVNTTISQIRLNF